MDILVSPNCSHLCPFSVAEGWQGTEGSSENITRLLPLSSAAALTADFQPLLQASIY